MKKGKILQDSEQARSDVVDKEEFSRRLVEKRKKAGFKSRAKFAERYDEKYNDGSKSVLESIKNYESGKGIPNTEILLRICNILGNCDPWYLLGFYDESTKDIHDIAKKLKLTETSISILSDALVQHGLSRIHPFVNALLESPYLERIAYEFNQLIIYKELYLQGPERYSQLIKTATIDPEDKEFLENNEYIKDADYSNLKFAEYKLFQVINMFVMSVSEGDNIEKKKEES